MKRTILKYLPLVFLAALLAGCNKKLEEQFRNPEVY
jgi:hypothetical protein